MKAFDSMIDLITDALRSYTGNLEADNASLKSRAETAEAKVGELLGTEKGKEPTEYGRKVEDPQDGKPSHYQVAWVFRHIRNHFLHGGTYRYLIYDRMGFNETAYTCMYEAGGMLISNTAYDLAEAITRATTAEAKVVQLAENTEKLERQLADKARDLLAEKLAHKDAKEDVETFRREVCGLHEQLTTTRAQLEHAREWIGHAVAALTSLPQDSFGEEVVETSENGEGYKYFILDELIARGRSALVEGE